MTIEPVTGIRVHIHADPHLVGEDEACVALGLLLAWVGMWAGAIGAAAFWAVLRWAGLA